MGFLELARKRKSTRNYSSERVPRHIIDRCLDAARLAPSACNSQPWSFIVIDDEEMKKDIAGKAFSGIYSMNGFAKKAAALIVAATERPGYLARMGGYFRGVQYSLVDIGIACEHLVLQAEEEGVGTCWLGWFNEKALKKALGIAKDKKVDIIISMGYPATGQEGDSGKKRRPLSEIRRFNK